MHLKPEQREIGKENFYASVGSEFTRRDFLKGSVAAAATGGAAAAIWMPKQTAITINSEMTKASRKRKPLFINSSSRKATSAVISWLRRDTISG